MIFIMTNFSIAIIAISSFFAALFLMVSLIQYKQGLSIENITDTLAEFVDE